MEKVVDTMEEKLNSILDQLEEVKDLELVNKLDIITLKNELEQLRFTILSLPPEGDKRINELIEISKNLENIKKWKSMSEEIDRLSSIIQKLDIPGSKYGYKPVSTERCRKCGSPLPPSGKFCGKCGQRVG